MSNVKNRPSLTKFLSFLEEADTKIAFLKAFRKVEKSFQNGKRPFQELNIPLNSITLLTLCIHFCSSFDLVL